jgi:hypothetical protein
MGWMKRHLVTGLVVLGLVLFGAIVFAFLVSLQKSNHGEIAGALGNIIGGTIGALGSAAAVYFMLKGQRNEEIEKTSAAVLREVAELCKSPIGQLGAIAGIQTGQIRVPKSELRQLFHTPTPTIYPAVADRINRLPRPTLVVTFYMQLQETMGLVAVLENSEPRDEIVTGGHIQVLADLLISQCQLARMILSSAAPDPERETALVTGQRNIMLKVLDEQLASAQQLFPNAEAFQTMSDARAK